MESAEFGSYITNAYGILKVIFSYLNGEDLMVASMVCREWYEVAWRLLHGSNSIRNYVRTSNGTWDKIDPRMAPCAAFHFVPQHGTEAGGFMPVLKEFYDTNYIPLITIGNCQNIFYDPGKPYEELDVMDYLLMFPKLPGVNIKFIYSASSTLLSYSVESEIGVPGAVQQKVLEHTCYECSPTKRRQEQPARTRRSKKEAALAGRIPPCAAFRRTRPNYSGPKINVPCAPPPDLAESKGVILIIKQKLGRTSVTPPNFFFGTNISLAGGVCSSIFMMDPEDPKSHKLDMLGISFSGENVTTHAGLHTMHVDFVEFLKSFADEVGPLPEGSQRVAFMFACVNREVYFRGYERSRFTKYFPNVPVYGFHSLGEFYLDPSENEPCCPPSKKRRSKRRFFYQECTSYLIVTYKVPSSSQL